MLVDSLAGFWMNRIVSGTNYRFCGVKTLEQMCTVNEFNSSTGYPKLNSRFSI